MKIRYDEADHAYEEMQAVFKSNGLDPIPCGFCHYGSGVWFYHFHARSSYFSKPPMKTIFDGCTQVLEKRRVTLAGSGFSKVGKNSWFFHFIILDNNGKQEANQ